MPTYDYKCENCEYEFEEVYSISKRNIPVGEPCENCETGKIQMKVTAPGIGDPVKLGIRKTDKNFNDKLNAIKKAHIGSTIQVRD
jgi:putative FmdB family regulatory protein|tara:strand:- start:48 stop:302 length:255 start_codon:yes stop_codon:yes gene_type:complete